MRCGALDDDSIRLFTRITLAAALVVTGLFGLPAAARAADKVKVGVFPVSSSLPFPSARSSATSRSSTSSRR